MSDTLTAVRALVLCLAAHLATAAGAAAQGIEDELRYLVGTIDPDGAGPGQARAYLLWQSQDPELLRGRSFAVYSKAGAPDDAGNFAQVATLKLLTRPPEIDAVLAANPGIVGDLAALEGSIDDLFGDLMPAAGLSLGTKLSALLLAAQQDPEVYAQLQLLSRVQPGVALCLGAGAALPLRGGGVTTYELRELPAPDVVVGRITVDPDKIVVLPAPGPPVEVPKTDAEGHLNARFRWGADEDLRRLSIHQYGYNLYRVERATAEAQGFHTTPPDPGVLAQLSDADPAITRVNILPVLPTDELTLAQAADLVRDPETYFLHDDNRRFVEGGVPFQDGDQFWYFVTARDVLARDGRTSPGTLVTIYDRMKPKAPRGVTVENFFARDPGTGAETRRLEVSWQTPPGPAPDGYRVYRWSSVPEIHQNATGDPEALAISPVIPHVPGQSILRYLDDGAGAPAPPASLGKTTWYTVRAFKEAAAGRIYSPNSPSGFGVLRERTGPDKASDAGIIISAACPTVTHTGTGIVPLVVDPGLRSNQRLANVVCERLDPRVAWVRMIHLDPDALQDPTGIFDSLPPIDLNPNQIDPPGWTVLPTRYFHDANTLQIPLPVSAEGGALICLAGMANGKQGLGFANLSNQAGLADDQAYAVAFDLDIAERSQTVSGGEAAPFPHDPLDPLTAEIDPIVIGFTTPPTAREWKIYRRVDLGSQTLFAVGTSTGDILVEDLELPPAGALICYYLQTFDEHGNPSVMQRLGCSQTLPRTKLPTPLVNPVTRTGTRSDPQARLEWFSESEGVDHFQVLVGVEDGLQVLGVTSNLWEFAPEVREEIDGRRLYAYRTPKLGGPFAAQDGLFALDLEVTAGQPFWFYVRAVGPGSTFGPLSEPAEFVWTEPPPPDPEVPWPARPLPPTDVEPLVSGKLSLELIDAPDQGFSGVGVRLGGLRISPGTLNFSLGEMTTLQGQGRRTPTTLPGSTPPDAFLYDVGTDESSPLPCVLYRYQVANDLFPNVSGKVVQVTPLIDRIRATVGVPPEGGGLVTRLVDPFVEIFPTDPAGDPEDHGIYLKDTHGVVTGATYAYLLVRFKTNGEIDRTFPLGTIEIN